MLQVEKPTTILATCEFRNSSGTLFNPTTVTATVTNPAGTETVYTYGVDATLTRSSTGIYVLSLLIDAKGGWPIVWNGSNASGQVTKTSQVDGI